MVLTVVLSGCGWLAEPGPVRSVPSEPLVELSTEGPLPYTMVWSDLAEMFPPTPGMVRPLAGLTPGAHGEVAEARLREVRKEGAAVEERAIDGHVAYATVLRHGSTEVGLTIVLDGATRTLRTVDLAVDWGAASAVLVERWGDPAPGPPPVDNGLAPSVWLGDEAWDAVLYRLPRGDGILQFRAIEARP